MKRIVTVFYLGFIMVFQFGYLGALELELSGGVNNMTLPPEKIAAGGEFEPFLYVFGSLSVKGEIDKAWGYKGTLQRDNILQNTADFRLITRTDYFSFEFGVFAGMIDAFEIPDAGILGSIEVTWPGILFFALEGSSTLGVQYNFSSDNKRETAGARLGFWVPFAVFTLSAKTKSLTWYGGVPDPVTDSLLRFQLSADIPFSKTSPFNLRIDAGYQTLKSEYTDETDEISSFFAGFDFQYTIKKSWGVFIGGEMPFLPKPKEPLKDSVQFWKMYKAHAGVKYKFK